MARAQRRSAVSRRRRIAVFVLVGALAGLGSVPAIWALTDELERQNDFCISCHLASGMPLHLDVRREFDAASPVSLAGIHGSSVVEERVAGADAAFRCIDCHGGTGLAGRARVKALAAQDLFWYLTSRFEEPRGMKWPLQEADCRRCHGEFRTKAGEFEEPAFHDRPLHNEGLGVGCVECHRAHRPGDASDYFLDGRHTRKQCARCHADLFE